MIICSGILRYHYCTVLVLINPIYKQIPLSSLAEVTIPKGGYFLICLSLGKGSFHEDFYRVSIQGISHRNLGGWGLQACYLQKVKIKCGEILELL